MTTASAYRRATGIALIFAAFLLILSGCEGNFPFDRTTTESSADSVGGSADDSTGEGSSSDEGTGVEFSLPPDSGSETVRTVDTFQFKTLHPVTLSVAVELYDPAAYSGDGEPAPLPPETAPVSVTLSDSAGDTVYRTVLADRSRAETQLYLPAAKEDMSLHLQAPGFEDRQITISKMVQYSRVERVLSMRASGATVQAMGTMPDSDGDGVLDAYDAAPTDPDTAFRQDIPAEGSLTVAYEDLFGKADAGDADYNDFIANYRITEERNEKGLTSIHVEATASEKLAGYNHRWGIRIDSFSGSATLEGTYIDWKGDPVEVSPRRVTAPAEIDLFKHTGNAEGESASFTLSFGSENPQNLDPESGEVVVDRPPYNPYLYVYRTGHDVHLIGEQALSRSINPESDFKDSEGFPWALLVPTDWEHPAEGQRIEEPYPRFTEWRKSGGTEETDWYIPEGDNQAPYPVVGGISDDDPNTPGVQQRFRYTKGQTFTLEIARDDAGRADPDGDAVTFASSPELGTGKLDYFTLDPRTGEVTFSFDGDAGEHTVRFYTVDEHGATSKDEAFVVDFIVSST